MSIIPFRVHDLMIRAQHLLIFLSFFSYRLDTHRLKLDYYTNLVHAAILLNTSVHSSEQFHQLLCMQSRIVYYYIVDTRL